MSSGSESEVVECHVPECHLPVDIILKSCDGEELGAHKSNLADFSGGFPPYESSQSSEEAGLWKIEQVDMPETGEALRYLLHIMHNAPQPDLSSLVVSNLIELAEAAEKYVVYHAIAICKSYMEKQVEGFPMRVLSYAVKHGHKDLANAAAYETIKKYDNVNMFIREAYTYELPEKDIIRWIRYRSRFTDASEVMLTYSVKAMMDGPNCKEWSPFVKDILAHIIKSPMDIFRFDKVVSNYRNSGGGSGLCYQCTHQVNKWIQDVQKMVPGKSFRYLDILERG